MTCLHYRKSRSEHRGMKLLNYIINTSRNKHPGTIHKLYKWIHSEVTISSTLFPWIGVWFFVGWSHYETWLRGSYPHLILCFVEVIVLLRVDIPTPTHLIGTRLDLILLYHPSLLIILVLKSKPSTLKAIFPKKEGIEGKRHMLGLYGVCRPPSKLNCLSCWRIL